MWHVRAWQIFLDPDESQQLESLVDGGWLLLVLAFPGAWLSGGQIVYPTLYPSYSTWSVALVPAT
eukprot:5161296-Ditylum_brightwellii.AAC.1